MTDRPVNRCAVKACPVIGHWNEGECCPIHRDRAAARPPTLAERWEVDRDAG